MPETTTQTLFTPSATPESIVSPSVGVSPLSGGLSAGLDMSQNEKDAIMRQIHPIFLTTHSEDKTPVIESNFDKFLGFMRLCLEGILKLVDIVVDAIIQVARLAVWIVAISGVLIVVTLMTNTTDKFIDLLNESIFKAFGIETRIEKVPSIENTIPASPDLGTNIKSDSISISEVTASDTATEPQSTRTRRRVQNIDTTAGIDSTGTPVE